MWFPVSFISAACAPPLQASISSKLRCSGFALVRASGELPHCRFGGRVKSGITRVTEDTEQMKKVKGEICSKILGNQKKIASSESDISKLTQTLELVQQERIGLSTKLSEKRAYYSMVVEDMNAKLQKQQEWIRAKMISSDLKEHELVKEKVDVQRSKIEGIILNFCDAWHFH